MDDLDFEELNKIGEDWGLKDKDKETSADSGKGEHDREGIEEEGNGEEGENEDMSEMVVDDQGEAGSLS